jgi:exopolysaccharide biosynthesis polyprenyl glycosylphosphotransferase
MTSSWRLASLVVDSLMLVAAGFAASLGASAAGVSGPGAAWLAGFSVVVVALLHLRGMYAERLRIQMLDDIRRVVTATSVAAMAILTLRVLVGQNPELAAQAIRPWAFATVYLAVGRIALSWAEQEARRQGDSLRPTLIVGAGRIAALVGRRLREHPELGLKPIGVLDKEPLQDGALSVGLPVLGASWDLEHVLREHEVEYVIVTFSTAPHEVLLRLANRAEELGARVVFVPRLFEQLTERLSIEYLGGLPMLSARRTNPKGLQFRLKYALDRGIAALGLTLALPVLVAAAIAVRASLGSPILYRQVRVGRDGRRFEILKFRSMVQTHEPQTEDQFELPPDIAPGGVEGADRRTALGSWLRRTSIDELPQLFNVLKGDMSLVGPRPERPEFVIRFEDSIHRYGDRHRVKSGITGWAQINGLRGQTSLADRVEWDNYYIENWSLWLDLKIMLATAQAVWACARNGE